MTGTVKKYLSLVKFSHTLFALPFALIAYVYALVSSPDIYFQWGLLVKILFCMIFARNTAMGFNRWADRVIDAQNPRTAEREIPSGQITPRAAALFVILNAVAFVVMAGLINRLTFLLSPLALFIICGYSYAKRFTAWAHIILGVALAIAPVGAYIAVTGTISILPLLLAAVVISWVSGFDILYSMQDAAFDRSQNLYSVPARFSVKSTLWISIALHLFTIYSVYVIGIYRPFEAGILYWIGAACFAVLIIFQHLMFVPSRMDRIGAWFGLVNGLSSLLFAGFAIADMLIK